MKAWWLTFDSHEPGCVEAPTAEEASAIADKLIGYVATSVKSLPYPASPRINIYKSEGGDNCPSFCFQPQTCAGRSSCPKLRSCSN